MFKQRKWSKPVIVGGAACALLLAAAFPATSHASPARATAPTLGTATSFAVLAGSAVTNTGATILSGSLGVSPGTAISGFPPGIVVGGSIHAGDAVAAQAQTDAAAAYNAIAGQPCNTDLTGQDLGGKTLIPGVYCFSSSAQLTGALTLDGLGNPNAVFIFRIVSTLTTASGASVLLINGAQVCNVFWQVGSSATFGTATSFAGNVLALASITLNTGAAINGSALAQTGAVTMDTNHVSASPCSAASTATSVAVPSSTPTTVPATATVAPGTATAIAAATNTAVAAPTATAVAAATSTALAGATATAIVAATGTAVTAPTGTAIAAATDTAVTASTATAVAAATSTSVAAATSTAAAAATPTPTSKPSKSATPSFVSTVTAPTRHRPSPTSFPVPKTIPHTGAGGFSLLSAARLVAAAASSQTLKPQMRHRSRQANRIAALPRTGGGTGGGVPISPLAPLALIAGLAIVAGRLVKRPNQR